MYLWLKRWLYGCHHDWVFISTFKTYESDAGNRPIKSTSVHRCSRCMKIRKDVFK